MDGDHSLALSQLQLPVRAYVRDKGTPCHGSWFLVSLHIHRQAAQARSPPSATTSFQDPSKNSKLPWKARFPDVAHTRAAPTPCETHDTAVSSVLHACSCCKHGSMDGGARHAHRIDQIGAGLPINAGHVESPPEPLSGPGH